MLFKSTTWWSYCSIYFDVDVRVITHVIIFHLRCFYLKRIQIISPNLFIHLLDYTSFNENMVDANAKITASSTFNNSYRYSPRRARLTTVNDRDGTGAWISKWNDANQYIQVLNCARYRKDSPFTFDATKIISTLGGLYVMIVLVSAWSDVYTFIHCLGQRDGQALICHYMHVLTIPSYSWLQFLCAPKNQVLQSGTAIQTIRKYINIRECT